MLEPKLNYLYFEPSDIIPMTEDNKLSKKQHWKTLEAYIKKYCHDRKYINNRDYKKLINNIKKLFNDMNFHGIFQDDNEDPLKDYALKCTGKSFEFILIFNSFSSMIIMHVTFFYGIADQVQISVSRTISDDENNNNDIDLSKHILSSRGMYYAMFSNDFQMDPYKACSLLTTFDSITSDAAKIIDREDIVSNSIVADALFKRFATFKYFCMNPEMREKYLLDDNTIDYQNIIKGDNIDDEHFTLENMMLLTQECDPYVEHLSLFTTIAPMLIDIKDLNYIIAETIIDTLLIDSLDTKTYIDNYGGQQSVDNNIILKLNELAYKYSSYYNTLLEQILKMDIKTNPLEQFNEYIDPPAYLHLDKDKMLSSDEDRKVVEEAFDLISKEDNVDLDKHEGYQRYLCEKEIYEQVHQYLKKNVKDYDLIFRNKNLQTIFCRGDVNMTCFANIDSILRLSSYKNRDRNYSLLEDQINESVSLMNFYTRADFDIEPTLDNLFKIYHEYVHPIIRAVNNMSENINSIQESLSMINFDNYFSNVNQNPNEDDDDD